MRINQKVINILAGITLAGITSGVKIDMYSVYQVQSQSEAEIIEYSKQPQIHSEDKLSNLDKIARDVKCYSLIPGTLALFGGVYNLGKPKGRGMIRTWERFD